MSTIDENLYEVVFVEVDGAQYDSSDVQYVMEVGDNNTNVIEYIEQMENGNVDIAGINDPSIIQYFANMDSKTSLIPKVERLETDNRPGENMPTSEDSKNFNVDSKWTVLDKISGPYFIAEEDVSADLVFTCDICNKSFKRENSLKLHRKMHSGGAAENECLECGKQFVHSGRLKVHMATHERKRANEIKVYDCLYCQMVFNKRKELKVHFITDHDGLQPVKCRECHNLFPDEVTLKDHIDSTHSTQKPYMCEECSRQFRHMAALKYHMTTHVDIGKPYTCEQCAKQFKSQSGLRCHKMTHTGIFKHKCEHCPKSFSQSCHYRAHLRTHISEKLFKCDRCTKQFRWKNSLTIHMKVHAGEPKMWRTEPELELEPNTEQYL